MRTLILQIQNRLNDGSVSIIPMMMTKSECPDQIESCMGAMMGMDLTPGDYTLVTTSNGYYEVLFTISFTRRWYNC